VFDRVRLALPDLGILPKALRSKRSDTLNLKTAVQAIKTKNH
jgi:hypothetical protein